MTDRERIETMVLRQQAVEAARGRGQFLQLEDCGSPPFRAEVRARDEFGSTIALSQGAGSTEADALRALLRDMGVEPWEWPATGCGALIGTPGRETTCGKGGICMGCWRIDNDPTLSMLGIGGES